jgi:hypothetical protein
MKKLGNKISLLYLIGVITILSVTIGCASSKPLVIDGEKSREIENKINVLAFDEQSELRGNSVSNIRNGGEAITDDNNLYVVQTMTFSEDESAHYLQKIQLSHLGSLTMKSDFIASLDAIIVNLSDNLLYLIDREENSVAKLVDLATGEVTLISDHPVSSFHFFDGKGYLSDATNNDILVVTTKDGILSTSTLISGGGEIIGVEQNRIYAYQEGSDHTVIVGYNRKTLRQEFELTGATFESAQISGSFLYYIEGDMLRRKLITDDCLCESASVIPTKEYALYSDYMVVAGIDEGMYLSKLDGSHIITLSQDIVSDIQLFEDIVLYKNGYDNNNWYFIQLSSGYRNALMGQAITDGGPQFVEIDEYRSASIGEFFTFFLMEAKEYQSSKISTGENFGDNLLFVDVRDSQWHYYTHIHNNFNGEDTDAIVIITNRDTVLGQYTDGDVAYRKDTVLTLFAPGDIHPIVTVVQEGLTPIDIKFGEGDRFGLPVSWYQKGIELIEMVK